MAEDKFLIGSHVGMSAPKMLLGSAEEAHQDGENVFMVYTGAPQNTRRKPIDELQIPEAHDYMQANGLEEIVIHAPYIINMGNTKKVHNFQFAIEFLKQEIDRSDAMGAEQIVLHPGSHVGAGSDAAIKQIIKGLNEVLTPDQHVQIAIETMAGKGTEVGISFEQIAQIIDGVAENDKLSVCFDTCHVSDAGYNVKEDFDGVLEQFDKIIGLDKLKVVHLNDSKNPQDSHKDRHANIGFGELGFDTLDYIAHHPALVDVPKILETPAIKIDDKIKIDPHKAEIEMLKTRKFNPNMIEDLKQEAGV